jgi:hypothetical protein
MTQHNVPALPPEDIGVAAGKTLSESVQQALGPSTFDVEVLVHVRRNRALRP